MLSLRISSITRRPLEEQGQRAVAVGDQVEGVTHAWAGGAAGCALAGGRGDGADAHFEPARWLRQVRQPDVVLAPGETDDLVLPARLRQPGIEANLDVHLVVADPPPPGHRQLGG
jgi:hypothetical protein